MAAKVVLFIDMLGFAALTERHPVDVDLFRKLQTPWVYDPETASAERRNPLVSAFTTFHAGLETTVEFQRNLHPLVSITFSDSAFVVCDYLYQACEVARRFIHFVLPLGVPVRIGVGAGSFASLRFKSDTAGEQASHASHFLGTGVVRAHAAERCGLKGIRVLLGPSAMPLLNDNEHNPERDGERSVRFVSCADGEIDNEVAVTHEVDYWTFHATREQEVWRRLQDMWDEAPPKHKVHYEATTCAIDRMRLGQGLEPLKDLRRRTLPKRKPHEPPSSFP